MEQYQKLLHLIEKINQETHNSEGIGIAQVADTCLITCSNSKWIINSRATDHIYSNLSLFTEYKVFDKKPNTITVADGKSVIVEQIGNVVFDNGIKLKNVLHVPRVRFNLISTHRLCQDLSCDIVLTSAKCLLQDYFQKHIMVLGNLESGLYTLSEQDVKPKKTIQVATVSEEAKLWHLRFGHLPFNKLHHVCSSTVCSSNLDIVC
ncbi:Retrovirus-related Pol polyprotein from transposon RE1 [Bienertia sinuspersici]